MSLEEQQEEQKVTNHYRVEITEFQEDSQDSEGKKSRLNFRAKTIIERNGGKIPEKRQVKVKKKLNTF